MNPTDTKHYTWIDYARFLTIFLIIYFHCPPKLYGFAGISMSLLRLPCFFFISGFLFRPDKYSTIKKFAIHRGKQLLVPYFCFSLIFYLFWLFIGRKIGAETDLNVPLYQPLIDFILGTPKLVAVPLWFLPSLFIIQCTFYFLIKNLSKRIVIAILFLLPFVPVLIDLSNTPYSLESICHFLPFYGIASLYRKEIMGFVAKKNHYVIGIICLLIHVVIVFFLMNNMNPFVERTLKIVGSFTIIFTVIIIIKIMADITGKQKFIEYISSNGVIVLAFHTYAILIFCSIMIHILHFQENYFEGNYYLKLVLAIISMLSMPIPIYIINKFLPFLIGKGSLFEEKC